MSITDELREWFKDRLFMGNGYAELTAIADRIDAEHEAMLVDARKTVYQGYIELPKDADGEYVHIDDVMEWPDGETFDVIGIGEGVLFYTESECDGPAEWTGASTKRHHHKPTVEDVLTEMVAKVIERGELTNGAAQTIAEYAAKLRLAEGVDA